MNVTLILKLIARVCLRPMQEVTVSNNNSVHAIKVKVGGGSRAMSTPWCWKVVSVNDHEILEQIVAEPVPPFFFLS